MLHDHTSRELRVVLIIVFLSYHLIYMKVEHSNLIPPTVIGILTHFEVKVLTEPCKLAANLICNWNLDILLDYFSLRDDFNIELKKKKKKKVVLTLKESIARAGVIAECRRLLQIYETMVLSRFKNFFFYMHRVILI